MKLNDLTNEYKRASEHLEALFLNEEITKDEVQDSLSSLNMEIEGKVLSIVDYITNLEKDSLALKERVKSLQDRKSVIDRRIEHLREYVKSAMTACEKGKIEGLDYVVSIAKSPPSLVIEDEDKIPLSYIEFEKIIDKERLKNDLKQGVSVEGATLTQGTSLRIK